MELAFFPLPPGLAELYAHLTYPAYAALLSRAADETITVIAASNGIYPVGLALAEGTPAASLLSLCVAPDWQGRGIGQQLLERVEQRLREKGVASMETCYMNSIPGAPAFERVLDKQGWVYGVPRMLFLHYDLRQKEAPDLSHIRYTNGYSSFPFLNLSSEERRAIVHNELGCPASLDPLAEEDRIEPLNSLGLRRQGRLVGWMVTHRISPQKIRYTSLFVEQSLQARGEALPLLAEAMRLQVACKEEVPEAVHGTSYEMAPMIRFAQRRLAPYAYKVARSLGGHKRLQPTPSPSAVA